MKKQTNKAGFTLLEATIVMAIMTTIVLFSVPSISEWIDASRLRTTSLEIATEVLRARGRAVAENQNISFSIVTGTGPDAIYQILPDGPVKHASRFVTITGVTGDNPLVFNSRGMASSDTTINMVNNKGKPKSVHINIAGRVEIN